MASIFGKPIQVDKSTSTFSRPSVARILVDLDTRRDFSEQIYISVGGKNGFSQRVYIENRLHYCNHCYKLGHPIQFCYFKNPNLRQNPPHQAKPIQVDQPLGLDPMPNSIGPLPSLEGNCLLQSSIP
ncbi:hypothetical protein AXF42_Ash004435 [Apostasia shenzhenica]|uniref:Zinc knuckle CX2CX4HX4C domain-containing protein n=1 Tax=Apostasia shenzhenica TaxID=1088818 RepID=A0A2I0A2Z7_9ASPA|nr:hypothetical protein AXF42_Ash004435 [Apostasia shenzhenica]